MLTSDEVLQILGEVCRVAPAELTPEMHLIRDLDLDSALTLDLLMTLEERLGTDLNEVDAAKLLTVGDVLEFVKQKGEGG